MVNKKHVEGYYSLMKELDQLGDDQSIFILFTGSKSSDGKSWCPDCVLAEPVIEEALKFADEEVVFIVCEVGSRAYWKNIQNDFRMDDRLKIKCVPTLMKWRTQKRLEEAQCQDSNMLKMLLED
ncbi:thioredoxin domain-containing protein 17-like [Limulus polyphemus]|uniref:Thioredoxin domain-containing protein 17 n=1 Tax=Limulus polyphemus TaxID=6850 RepID=A0ABM1BBN1_LIMPO|nr:thioredoxin domain-containing protein 17-like [Limulus polyphemus]